MFRSVTSRLIVFYCVLLVMLGGAFLAFTATSFRHYIRQTVVASLEARTGEIWNTSQDLLHNPPRLAQAIRGRFSPESQDRFIRIRAAGRVVYRSGDPTEGDFSPAAVPLTSPRGTPRIVQHGNLILYSRRFDGPDGPVIIDCGQSYQFAHQVEDRLISSLLVGLPILLLAAAVAGYGLMRRALKPVEVMINAAEAYTFNKPHSRLPLVGAEPRIEALGLALNRMLDRLDAAYSHVSRFSADSAHELRTPLTIIRGELELAAQVNRSPEVARAMSVALDEMTRLTGIVDSLINLSMMESLWGKHAHSSVDLRALASETIEQMSLMADEKEIALSRPAGAPVLVAGDRGRLKQILVNLVDNAIKYTPQGGTVTVNVGAAGDAAILMVEDSGIGIDPSHHDKVFDRFYRVSTDRGEVGAGLGLAIVKSVVHAHGGRVSLRSAPGIGSCFTVELPLQRAGISITENSPENAVAAAGAAAAIRCNNDNA